MAKPKTIHTLESLKARATEEGDCLLWNDFCANGTPMVHENGAMVPVRKILLRLVGIPQTARYLCPKCDNPACIEPKHIVQRTEATHARKMSKQSHTTHAAKRKAGVIVWRRQNPLKLDMDKAQAIRADDRGERRACSGVRHLPLDGFQDQVGLRVEGLQQSLRWPAVPREFLMNANQLHRRRMQFNDVIRQLALQLPIAVPGPAGDLFPLSVSMAAWKDFVRGKFFPSRSPDDAVREPDWNETLHRIQSWAAGRGAAVNTNTLTTKETP